jgi:hypothetical protein
MIDLTRSRVVLPADEDDACSVERRTVNDVGCTLSMTALSLPVTDVSLLLSAEKFRKRTEVFADVDFTRKVTRATAVRVVVNAPLVPPPILMTPPTESMACSPGIGCGMAVVNSTLRASKKVVSSWLTGRG